MTGSAPLVETEEDRWAIETLRDGGAHRLADLLDKATEPSAEAGRNPEDQAAVEV